NLVDVLFQGLCSGNEKKLSADSGGCVVSIVALVCWAISAFTNATVAWVILALPVVICALWIVWKIIVDGWNKSLFAHR
ncbi:MAG: hypothetical protein J6S24_04060, partial [Lentisphaeria bacterium]|nr:hypothetical protein [Lentisphaeria bacterium]